MLNLPESGILPYSEKKGHRSDLNVFTDWLEGSLLFGTDDTLSIAEIKDVLTDEHVYEDQDKASELLSDVWRNIDFRNSALGNSYPIAAKNSKLTRKMKWQQSPAYSFCLLLSFANCYPKWARKSGSNFTEQGLLFEQITAEALCHEMTDWKTHSTGWSRAQTDKIQDRVEQVRGMLKEDQGRLDRIPSLRTIKDAGLDLVLWRPFSDNRIGSPLYLVQCASGANWESKRTEPDIHLWRTLIDFAALPRKALVIPYALSDREHWISCRRMNGMLIDRMRLLSGGRRRSDWVSAGVSKRTISWMRPRIRELPKF